MRTSSKKRFDFFTEYHKEKLSKITSYLFSWVFAIFLAFSFVSYSQNNDLGGLMASVANLTSSPKYEADLILERSGNTAKLVFGATATKVDNLSFTILTDPVHVRSLKTDSKDVTLSSLEGGMYHGVIAVSGVDLAPGAIVASFVLDADENASMNLIDTKFASEWAEYTITNKTNE